jgi:hypothetical protein
MEAFMAAGQRYRKILSELLPAGALGMSILLGSAAAEAAREAPATGPSGLAPPTRVAERLAAIRDAVSDVAPIADRVAPLDGAEQLAWRNWGNGGIGIGIDGFGIGIGVPSWNNWGNGWKNWKNNWSNGWNNWGNGWNNY